MLTGFVRQLSRVPTEVIEANRSASAGVIPAFVLSEGSECFPRNRLHPTDEYRHHRVFSPPSPRMVPTDQLSSNIQKSLLYNICTSLAWQLYQSTETSRN